MSGARPELDLDGAAAPPRRNGELVFAAPWESRLFGIALALCESGLFDWEEFRALLIAEIAAFDAAPRPAHEWSYYACWQAALERLLAQRGAVSPADLEARAQSFAARPAGHDH